MKFSARKLSVLNLSLGCLLLCLVCVSGCSRAGVQGTVKKNDKDVAFGEIRFSPMEGEGKSFSTSVENGAFKYEDDFESGDYRIEIRIRFADKSGAAEYYKHLEEPMKQQPEGAPPQDIHVFNRKLRKGKSHKFTFNIKD